MLAVSSAGWTGMGFIDDINGGVMDRVLASPVWRGALNLGSVVLGGDHDLIQTALILGARAGARRRLHNGVGGVLILILVAGLLGAAFASLSNGVGVLARQRETLIGAVSLVLLPLTFLSSALMQQDLVPGWIRTVGDVQPGQLGRRGRPLGRDGRHRLGPVASRIGLLLALVVLSRDVRYAGLRDLSALAVTRLERPAGRRSNRRSAGAGRVSPPTRRASRRGSRAARGSPG